ncbi:MAG: hypothetical protein ACLTDO_07160 [Bifidobacterium pseudocatenulatum]
MRRFLVSALPNLRTAPNRQTFARAKIHPVDTSLSVQTMLSKGRDPMVNPVDYGNLSSRSSSTRFCHLCSGPAFIPIASIGANQAPVPRRSISSW